MSAHEVLSEPLPDAVQNATITADARWLEQTRGLKLPRTLSGKPLEVPVKRILMGEDPDTVVSRDALADPAALDDVIALARQRLAETA